MYVVDKHQLVGVVGEASAYPCTAPHFCDFQSQGSWSGSQSHSKTQGLRKDKAKDIHCLSSDNLLGGYRENFNVKLHRFMLVGESIL